MLINLNAKLTLRVTQEQQYFVAHATMDTISLAVIFASREIFPIAKHIILSL